MSLGCIHRFLDDSILAVVYVELNEFIEQTLAIILGVTNLRQKKSRMNAIYLIGLIFRYKYRNPLFIDDLPFECVRVFHCATTMRVWCVYGIMVRYNSTVQP